VEQVVEEQEEQVEVLILEQQEQLIQVVVVVEQELLTLTGIQLVQGLQEVQE
jgi:hypothetical protein